MLFVLTGRDDSPSLMLLEHCKEELSTYSAPNSKRPFHEHFSSIEVFRAKGSESVAPPARHLSQAMSAGRQVLIFDDGVGDPLHVIDASAGAPVVALCDVRLHAAAQAAQHRGRLVVQADLLAAPTSETVSGWRRELREAGSGFILFIGLEILAPAYAPTYKPAGGWTSRQLMRVCRELLRHPWSGVVIEGLGVTHRGDRIARLSAAAAVRAVLYAMVG